MNVDRRNLLRAGTCLGALAFGGGFASVAIAAAPSASRRVEALLARMTIEEKVGQLTLYPDDVRPTPRPINPDINAQAEARERSAFQFAEVKAGRVGSLLAGTGVELGRKLQDAALQSRLGIPLMFGADVLHGLRTIFPIPLALAASFEPGLAERTARAAAEEMSAVGVHWTYAPMVDVARDQRWGRVAEGSGEDPLLASLFAASYVKGFQGNDLKSPRSVAACPKHFAGYGAVIGGMEYNSTDLTERELLQTHMPPFEAAFSAGAVTTMAAFNDIDGVPASGNRHLLTDLLRGRLGFQGFVVSDAASAEELVAHGIASDEKDAARQAFDAGVAINMGGGLYKRHLPDLVASGAVGTERLDEAVRRVLTVKEQLGLLDDPYRSLDPRREARDVRTPAALALAREAATRSVVLLKNEGNVLPLAAGRKVALIGPLADDEANMDGPWAPWAKTNEAVTLAQGLRAALGADRLTVTKGAEIQEPLTGGIEAAVAAAKAADVVVLALGEGQDMSGEARSRSEIIVPAAQQALAEAVAAIGKPVVVVLSCGRALALEGAVRNAGAIVVGWFLGSQGGHALADVLTGRVAPSGRLPVSFPQVSGQQPFFYNHKSTGRPQLQGENAFFKARYSDVSHQALYPFGHGLGYGVVAYGEVELSTTTLAWNGQLVASVTVSNQGDRAVDEVVQLYVHDESASVTRPVRELKGFEKVRMAAGASRKVNFIITRKDLEFVGGDLLWRAEPGRFQVWIAPSSAAGRSQTFILDNPA
ncbi:glycoside hydrolase family 3 N-terminal domain-containing protein [Novosphingobium sp. HR1a]|nr:glycoside hydrolase family 3 N-terminal domain-containing protein [Novosphingobium sp. HR1a]MBF7015685.1 glycoside hydrolase family 3 C-terminal domain-containing protein [Novosphingobium sp. HR1a]